jgi:hypothetical protein
VNRLFIKDTPIHLLDDELFFGINHTLFELHIVNSKLAEFPSGAFKVIIKSIILNENYFL